MIKRALGEVWRDEAPANRNRPWYVQMPKGKLSCQTQEEAEDFASTLDSSEYQEQLKRSLVEAMTAITDRYGYNESDVPSEHYSRWMNFNAKLYPLLDEGEQATYSIYGAPGLRDGKNVTYPDAAEESPAALYVRDRLQVSAYRQRQCQIQEERLLARIRGRVQESDDNMLRFFVLNDLPNILKELQQLDGERRAAAHDDDLLNDILVKLEGPAGLDA